MEYLLLAILVFLMASVLWSWYSREGYTSGKTPKDLNKKLDDINTRLNGEVNLSNFRDDIESMIPKLESWADHSMASLISQGKFEDAEKSADSIRLFNDLVVFKKNLADFLTVVDKLE